MASPGTSDPYPKYGAADPGFAFEPERPYGSDHQEVAGGRQRSQFGQSLASFSGQPAGHSPTIEVW